MKIVKQPRLFTRLGECGGRTKPEQESLYSNNPSCADSMIQSTLDIIPLYWYKPFSFKGLLHTSKSFCCKNFTHVCSVLCSFCSSNHGFFFIFFISITQLQNNMLIHRCIIYIILILPKTLNTHQQTSRQ